MLSLDHVKQTNHEAVTWMHRIDENLVAVSLMECGREQDTGQLALPVPAIIAHALLIVHRVEQDALRRRSFMKSGRNVDDARVLGAQQERDQLARQREMADEVRLKHALEPILRC